MRQTTDQRITARARGTTFVIERREPHGRRLTADDVATESATSPAYVARLAEWGALQPGSDGLFEPADVHRVRTVHAIDEAGFAPDAAQWTVATGLLPLDRMGDRLWHIEEPSGRTYAEFRASLDAGGAELPAIYAALGLPEPPPDAQ